MRDKFVSFISDNYKIGMVILELLLLVSMPFNPELEYTHFTYFTLISRILFPFIVLFFGDKGIWIFFFCTSVVNTLDITFDDFTALSAFCLLYLFIPSEKKSLKVFTVLTYLVNIFIVANLHDKQPYHLFAHFIGCGMLILSVQKLKYGEVKVTGFQKLKLTNDEILIIEEMIKGKQQKEIELFSPNTVTNKLKQARERNNISTTDELLCKYRDNYKLL